MVWCGEVWYGVVWWGVLGCGGTLNLVVDGVALMNKKFLQSKVVAKEEF